MHAVGLATAGRPNVRAVYLFAQLDDGGVGTICVGVQLAPGCRADAVMPAIADSLARRVPIGSVVRLLALSRRMLAEVRRHTEPLPPEGGGGGAGPD